MTIAEIVRLIMADEIKPQLIIGKVKSVDTSKNTCEIEVEGAPTMLDVRLRAVIDSSKDGLIVVPKNGSYVIVAMIENKRESAFVFGHSDVESIQLFNDKNGGLVISEKVSDELNDIRSHINDLKQVFLTWVPSAYDGGAGLKGGVAQWAADLQLPIQASKLENKKVKHGE